MDKWSTIPVPTGTKERFTKGQLKASVRKNTKLAAYEYLEMLLEVDEHDNDSIKRKG